ncbi:hypothetical protein [Nonomuraea sp. NPDC049309]|uniref:hypothetical protein n=1 Tax=Nonomuraea sp. NPDC049309 TaxID=3364350 RepID=UPI00371006A5
MRRAGGASRPVSAEIDELIVKSHPVVAGGGISMFNGDFQPTQFTVTHREIFSNGSQVTWLTRP